MLVLPLVFCVFQADSPFLQIVIDVDVTQTCQVSRNVCESPEMVHDFHVSRRCYKISRNVGNLIDILFFCNKTRFWCECERLVASQFRPTCPKHKRICLYGFSDCFDLDFYIMNNMSALCPLSNSGYALCQSQHFHLCRSRPNLNLHLGYFVMIQDPPPYRSKIGNFYNQLQLVCSM